MKFVSVRDLRGRSAEVWRVLAAEHELIVTSNGKPIAIMSSTDEGSFEQSINELRRARALRALSVLQHRSVEKGRDKLPAHDIDTEIAEVRRAWRR